MLSKRLVGWVDSRVGGSRVVRRAMAKVFPNHWSFLLGEIALYSLIVLIVTGMFLTFFFVPDAERIVYTGSYAPMRGVAMSRAYQSTLGLSFDVRAGLVMRQMHHWAAVVFVAAIVVHLMRVFFTGAFRRPRELNWMVGVTLLILAIVNGFTGYSLPDDLLSGTGLRIAYSIAISIPVIGPWLASLAFGGEFPAPQLLSRLYTIHVLMVPALIVALLGVHLALLVRQKHTQYPGPGRTEDNVVGSRLWPRFAVQAGGFFLLVSGVLAGLGGLVQINPVWLYGPYDPAQVSAPAQPDWYMGWLEGALRIFPNWEIRLFGFEVPNVFFPGVLLAGVAFLILYLWPFIEARFTGDHAIHHLLDRPSDRPLRTSLGAGALAFFFVLFIAGGNDVIAATMHLSVNAITETFRVLVVVVPVMVALITHRLTMERSRWRVRPQARPISRTGGGGYRESGTEE